MKRYQSWYRPSNHALTALNARQERRRIRQTLRLAIADQTRRLRIFERLTDGMLP